MDRAIVNKNPSSRKKANKILTLRDGLNHLPYPVNEMAIKYAGKKMASSSCRNSTPSLCLSRSFLWDETEEGHDFWAKFASELEDLFG